MEKIGDADNGQGVLVKMSRSGWGHLTTLRQVAQQTLGMELENSRFGNDLTPVLQAVSRWTSGGFALRDLRKWIDKLEETLVPEE